MTPTEIRPMQKEDWKCVCRIYAEGINTGFATFETVVPTYEVWDSSHLETCRMVATEDGKIMGWAALSPVSGRWVYAGVAEVSIYIGKEARGRGFGRLLMQALIEESEHAGLWTLQSGIFPENKGSIVLHEKMGFRYIGKRERVGQRCGVWKDNLLFERRSIKIGVE